ncbi:Gm26620 [Phodopus roborovskii]|uniref:Gm26620 protein n=1 Tax=Phodopus roborovskii TaxID=109678 RepID=A0AAU9Z9V0_PHORO|nr:Gm26620 [Phodopus roborovskii]
MKATQRSRWLSKSVSGSSRAGTKRVRRPSNPAPAWKPGSESTVSTAVMPASIRWSGSATAAAPPRYSPGRTSTVRPAELEGLVTAVWLSPPWFKPCASNMAAPGRQAAAARPQSRRLERPLANSRPSQRRGRTTAMGGMTGSAEGDVRLAEAVLSEPPPSGQLSTQPSKVQDRK